MKRRNKIFFKALTLSVLAVLITSVPSVTYSLQSAQANQNYELTLSKENGPSEVVASGSFVAKTKLNNDVTFNYIGASTFEDGLMTLTDGKLYLAGSENAKLTGVNSVTAVFSGTGALTAKVGYEFATVENVRPLTSGVKTSWAYTYNSISLEAVGQVDIESITFNFVCEEASKTHHIADYDFNALNATDGGATQWVHDNSVNNRDLLVNVEGKFTSDGESVVFDETFDQHVYNPDWYSTSITVEAVAKVQNVFVPASGDRWFPIVCKDGEFFIGYWTTSATPGMARLCYVVQTQGGAPYEGIFFDDTSLWLSLDSINDGNFHHYALSYNSLTGTTNYYFDYATVEKLNTAPVRVAGASRMNATTVFYAGAGWGFRTNITFDHLRLTDAAISPVDFYRRGVIADFDFTKVTNSMVADKSSNNHLINLNFGSAVENTHYVVKENGLELINITSPILPSRALDTASLTIDLTFTLHNVNADTTRWYPLLASDFEFFIGLWTDANQPGKARICMSMVTGDMADNYWDDTNMWIDLADFNDVEHRLTLSYNAATGRMDCALDGAIYGGANRPSGLGRKIHLVNNAASNIWFASGFGATTHVTFKSLTFIG